MAPQPSPTPNRTVSETAQTPVTDTLVTTRETSTIFHTASPEADNPVSLSNTSLTYAPQWRIQDLTKGVLNDLRAKRARKIGGHAHFC